MVQPSVVSNIAGLVFWLLPAILSARSLMRSHDSRQEGRYSAQRSYLQRLWLDYWITSGGVSLFGQLLLFSSYLKGAQFVCQATQFVLLGYWLCQHASVTETTGTAFDTETLQEEGPEVVGTRSGYIKSGPDGSGVEELKRAVPSKALGRQGNEAELSSTGTDTRDFDDDAESDTSSVSNSDLASLFSDNGDDDDLSAISNSYPSGPENASRAGEEQIWPATDPSAKRESFEVDPKRRNLGAISAPTSLQAEITKIAASSEPELQTLLAFHNSFPPSQPSSPLFARPPSDSQTSTTSILPSVAPLALPRRDRRRSRTSVVSSVAPLTTPSSGMGRIRGLKGTLPGHRRNRTIDPGTRVRESLDELLKAEGAFDIVSP